MSPSLRSLSADQVKVGDQLPPLRVAVSATTVVMGASATRDWQPQHHDHVWATQRAGTRDIFMNTPTQAGWISRYVTDWCGPAARLGRMAFRMKSTICPGDAMVINGIVKSFRHDDSGCCWAQIDVEIKVGETLCTICSVAVALPASGGVDNPWRRQGEQWRVAELAASASNT